MMQLESAASQSDFNPLFVMTDRCQSIVLPLWVSTALPRGSYIWPNGGRKVEIHDIRLLRYSCRWRADIKHEVRSAFGH